MPRVLATLLSACIMLGLGIVSLQFRVDDLSDANLSGANASAFNLTKAVSTDATVIAGNALPTLTMVVFVVMVIVMLLLNR